MAVQHRQPRPRGPALPWAVLAMLALSVPILLLTELLNPDWYGYAQIFQEDGAWLAEQGRDPLFLLIIRGAIACFGSDGYEAFREALGWGFIALAGWLGWGAGWHQAPGGRLGWGLLLAVLNFGLTRFTVQIREGMATVLLLLGLRWASHDRARHATTLALLGSALIHGGTGLVLAGWLLALVTAPRSGPAPRARPLVLGLVGGFVLGGLAFSAIDAGSTVDDLFGREELGDASALGKTIYWSLLGVCSVLAARLASLAYTDPREVLTRAVHAWGWWLMPAVFGVLMAEFATGQTLALVASTARGLALFTALLLLLAALRGRWSHTASAAVLFLLADQCRTLVQSVITTFGGAGGLGG